MGEDLTPTRDETTSPEGLERGDFMRRLGIRTVERSREHLRTEIDIGPEHHNPNGVAQGGVLYTLADSGMAGALHQHLEPDEICATIEVKIVYTAPVRIGTVTCTTRVLHRGRRVATLESEMHLEDRLVAKALGTFAILERR